MTITTLPIWFTDTAGAACMIVLSFLCIHHARQLGRRDPANIKGNPPKQRMQQEHNR